MTVRDIFALVLRSLGAFFVFKAFEGGAQLAAVGCGFDMHLRNAPNADAFVYLWYIVVGLAFIAWADRAASIVYKGAQPKTPTADGVKV